MNLVYIAMLLHKAGKEINEENVKKVADAAGIKAEDAQIKGLVAALDGVDIDKEIKEAAVMPSVPVAEEKTEKKEEAKEEKKAEEAAAGLGALFG